jgi:hypothetical protein
MDVVGLLRRAAEAGLAVTTEGDRLVVRGPRAAESLAQELIRNKPAVMAALSRVNGADVNYDDTVELDWTNVTPCKRCESLELWWNGNGEARCMWCEPPTAAMNLLTRANEIRSRHATNGGQRRTASAEPHCRRCFSTQFVDTKVHGGRSIRRDCAHCGLTAGFPMWWGKVDARFGAM